MIVLTVDRRRSREREDDGVADAASRLQQAHGATLLLPVARFAGDELQLVTDDGSTAAGVALKLTRDDAWSVGIGIGDGELAEDAASSTGPAFFAARDAIDRAKASVPHLAITRQPDDGALTARDAEVVLRLLIEQRARRSPEGWEVSDLLGEGLTQKQIAERLGISAAAVSARVKAASVKSLSEVAVTLGRMLNALNGSGS
ncbi:MAG: winged helix-turn-helix transcriptional regulator [Microbacterium sp.]